MQIFFLDSELIMDNSIIWLLYSTLIWAPQEHHDQLGLD